jgi:hypothetical protein
MPRLGQRRRRQYHQLRSSAFTVSILVWISSVLGVPDAMDVDSCVYKAKGIMNPGPVCNTVPRVVAFRAFEGVLQSHENRLV